MTVVLTNPERANSTSYADLLGLLVGAERLPGESTADFRDRILRLVAGSRGPEYTGLLNELTLQLGLKIRPVISLTGPSDTQVTADISGVRVRNSVEEVESQLLEIDVDDVWEWRKLSDVVASINSLATTVVAELLVEDGPALQLARQSNVLTVRAQPIQGKQVSLGHSGIVVGSERFSVLVSSYELTEAGVLRFDSPVPAGARVTYQRRIWPYSLVGSEVGLIGLLDSALDAVAENADGKLVYQLRETVQSLMQRDRSYWGS